MRVVTFLFCAFLSIFPAASNASLITTNFSGVLTGQFGPIPTQLSSIYSIGESFSGRYVYDSGLPAYVLQEDTNWYDGFSELTITIGSNTWSAPMAWAQLTNNQGGVDVFQVDAGTSPGGVYDMVGPTVNGYKLAMPQIQFLDNSGSVFSTKDLPTAPLNLQQFSNGYATLLFANTSYQYAGIWGQVNSLSGSISPVPLPAAAWLLISGAGLLGAAAKRRKIPAVQA